MALIVDILLIPINAGMKLLSKLSSGFLSIGSSMGVSTIDMIETMFYSFKYTSPSALEIIQIVGFLILSLVITIVGFILLNIYLPNGALNSFKVYLEENRIVKFKEFCKLTKLNVKEYLKSLIMIVALPILAIK